MDIIDTLDWLRGMPTRELRRVAAGSGVSFYTLHKISSGVTADPGVLTLKRVAEYRATLREAEAA
ncbi:MAG: hypothetical protein KGO50_13700 [Myxococcales bacterium]|nr:hypothetical protein [Myxococcales bacterium]